MQKFFRIGIVLALMVSVVNIAFADEFDPIANLANDDALLGLDLPSDLGDFDTLSIPATADEPIANAPVATELALVIPTAIPTTSGSGGALGEETTPAATQANSASFYTPTPIQLYSSTATSASVVEASYDYSTHAAARAQLTPTGPAATLALAALAALGLAFIFRKKIANV